MESPECQAAVDAIIASLVANDPIATTIALIEAAIALAKNVQVIAALNQLLSAATEGQPQNVLLQMALAIRALVRASSGGN